jgi:hypothetical protein
MVHLQCTFSLVRMKVRDSDVLLWVRGQRKMSQVLGAFGLLDFTLLRPVQAWRAFWNLWTVYFLNFTGFFSDRGSNTGAWLYLRLRKNISWQHDRGSDIWTAKASTCWYPGCVLRFVLAYSTLCPLLRQDWTRSSKLEQLTALLTFVNKKQARPKAELSWLITSLRVIDRRDVMFYFKETSERLETTSLLRVTGCIFFCRCKLMFTETH